MSSPKTNTLLRHIRQIAAHPHGGHAPDAELLERFLSQHDEEAFSNLLRRHGPMVLAVCGSIVSDRHLAEDAFQATFLLLAKKAHWIYKRASIGSWLHGVARHVAMKARRSAVKHRVQESKCERAASSDPMLDMNLREVQAALHEELERLPEKYRAPVVLCYLEGMTHEQAGRQLGWTPGTVRGRVNRGRELLRGRLTRRGLAVPAALLGVVLETPVRALAMSAVFVSQTVNAALATVAGQATVGLISAPVASLVRSGIRVLALSKLKVATVSALAVALIGVTAWTAASSALGLNPHAAKAAKDLLQTSVKKHDDQGGQVAKDVYGDPLPVGALARLGTISLRHGEAIQAIAFSPDGKTIACTAGAKFISVWDRSTGKEVRRITDANGTALAFSPDGGLLATAGGKYVELFDAATGERLHQLGNQTFTQKGDSTFSMRKVPLVFSADGRMVASANSDHIAVVWDTSTGKELMRTVPMENPNFLRFLPDGNTLLSLSGARQVDGAIQLWEVTTGKEISKVVIDHKKTLGSQPLGIAPDGKTVAIESLVLMREKRGNSTIVYTAHCIRLLDATTGQLRLHIQGKNSVIHNVAFSPDSRCLAWTNMDNEVTIWDTQADKLVRRFQQAAGGEGGSSALAYDREGKTLATSSEGTALHLWDLVRGKELLNKEAHGSSIRAVVHSPDGRAIASASADQTVRVWDAKTGKPLTKLTGHAGAADAIACSHDGRHLATAASDGTVRLWDRSTGREIHQFTLPNIDTGNGGARVVSRSVSFTPDSQTLIAAGSDLKFHKWDVGTGKELEQRSWSLDGVEQPGNETERFVNPSHVRFSPDGRTAAATGGKA
ncbi:MAG TPA: sigma-70 family RNA polymerase sigma factor, partial [Gemmataceae bacterium]|nr:sigma-70 family RNA polymerase sigma factor [Gemmataceae bacterium]